jgi:hypothetical protein
MKLSMDQRDRLSDLVSSQTWPDVVYVCQELLKLHETKLLVAPLALTDREIANLRAKLEGARDFARGLNGLKETLRGKNGN